MILVLLSSYFLFYFVTVPLCHVLLTVPPSVPFSLLPVFFIHLSFPTLLYLHLIPSLVCVCVCVCVCVVFVLPPVFISSLRSLVCLLLLSVFLTHF